MDRAHSRVLYRRVLIGYTIMGIVLAVAAFSCFCNLWCITRWDVAIQLRAGCIMAHYTDSAFTKQVLGASLGIGGSDPPLLIPELSLSEWRISVPLWMPAAVVGIVTSVYWRRDVRRRRANMLGLCCTACDYSLIGITRDASGCLRCPECGVAVKASLPSEGDTR